MDGLLPQYEGAVMAEILVKAVDAVHPDPETDRRGCYKRGMPVVVMPDGHPWGLGERLPTFIVLKLPMVPVEKVRGYIEEQWVHVFSDEVYRRRRWQVRWAYLPAAARTKLASTGGLTIKATPAYVGTYDYTWTQIRTYFRDLLTGLDETADL